MSRYWPPQEVDDRDTATIVVTSKPDQLGRSSFWIRWFDEQRCQMNDDKLDPRPLGWRRGWRAQHFFADPHSYERKWLRSRLRVVMVEEIKA